MLLDLLRDPVLQVWGGIAISAIIGIGGIFIPIIRDRPPRKLVTHQLRSDAPILSVDAGGRGLQGRLQVLFDKNELQDPRLIVLKVRNSGKVLINDTDYDPVPEFRFPGHEVLSGEVIETEPTGIFRSRTLTIHQGSLAKQIPGSIQLPPIPLNREDSITLNALLIGSGDGSGKRYSPSGRILGGKFLRYEPNRGLSRRTLIFVGVSTLLIGIILTATLLSRFVFAASQPQNCVSGTLNIGGSTAMYPFVHQVAQKYQDRCSGAVITVNQNIVNSRSGLLEVENNNIQIGDSDVLTSKDQRDLVDHPVAVVNYVVVVGSDVTGVGDLSLKQLRDIYSGRITNWSEVGGPNRSIYVISRPQASGTRQTFESYVLECSENLSGINRNHEELTGESEVANEIQQKQHSAIGYMGIGTASEKGLKYLTIEGEQATPENLEANNYKFWAVEHMYTKGIAQGLTKSFLDYMTADSATVVATSLHYVSYNLMTPTALNSQQNPSAITPC